MRCWKNSRTGSRGAVFTEELAVAIPELKGPAKSKGRRHALPRTYLPILYAA